MSLHHGESGHDELGLTFREVRVLEAIVRNYILTAAPTSSRFIAKKKICDLSSASIRNIMGDLEEKGLINHPHTSAGRIPTDKGFRYYVDQLMHQERLPERVKKEIRHHLTDVDPSDLHLLLETASRALSKATDQLGVILSPKVRSGIFRHLYIYPVESQRYLLNVTIDSGFVKTLIVEVSSTIEQERVERACNIINERCRGKSLGDVFYADSEPIEDQRRDDIGVIKLFIPSIQKMLEKEELSEIYTKGETTILLKPEFTSREHLSTIVEMLEEKKLLIHILSCRQQTQGNAIVSIGGEIEDGRFSSLSVVKTAYKVGNMEGSLGVIGPKRMPYPLMVSAVEYTAQMLQELSR